MSVFKGNFHLGCCFPVTDIKFNGYLECCSSRQTHATFTSSFHPVVLLDVPHRSESRLLLSGLKVNQGLTFLFYSLLLFQSVFPPSKCCLSTPQLSDIPCSQSNIFKIWKHLQIYTHILSYRNNCLLLIASTSNKLLATLLYNSN